MSEDAIKTVTGALLIGASVATGNAVVMSVAGGVGVNWVSEGVAGLWSSSPLSGVAPDTALPRAYTRAIRQATKQLQSDYQRSINPQGDTRAFALLETTAATIANVAALPAKMPMDALQGELDQALDQLLLGHDTQLVAWVKPQLLPRVASAFQHELLNDPKAMHQFHHWLLQQLAHQITGIHIKLDRLPEVLTALQKDDVFQQSLIQSVSRLETQMADLRSSVDTLDQQAKRTTTTPPTTKSSVFDNSGMTVSGNLTQIQGNHYQNSSHASGNGTAITINGQPIVEPHQEKKSGAS